MSIYTWFQSCALLIVSVSAFSQESAAPACDKPYEHGRLIVTSTEDLRRDTSKACTKKQLNSGNGEKLAAKCNAFVRQHPNKFVVSENLTDTLKGCATFTYRCESFCGTQEDLDRVMQGAIQKDQAK